MTFGLRHGELDDRDDAPVPVRLSGWSGRVLDLPARCTHYGVVFDGRATMTAPAGTFDLGAGMYFAVPGPSTISGTGRGLVVTVTGHGALFHIGGPLEGAGRLRYIDGCTDTLLVPPTLKGDPCLNLLCFPAGVDQTPHTHPSLRAGIVFSGSGWCRTENGVIPLRPGQAFVISAGRVHSFVTTAEPMRIVAFHPDSDFGPTHQDHPMINRTLVNGVSAARLGHVQTRQDP